jgi:hypothetical protein
MKIEVFKATEEDWYPSYDLGVEKMKLLRVAFMPLRAWKDNPEQWRVCVWGADDFGMEKDFIHKDEAHRAFTYIIELDLITVDELKSIGFVYA